MGLSPMQLLIILIIAVVVFGTSKFKNAGKDLGGAVKGFKDAVKDETQNPTHSKQTLEHKEGVSVDEVKVEDVKVKDTQV